MVSRVNGAVWMEGEEEEEAVSWPRISEKQDELGLSTFKSLLEEDWYMNSNSNPSQNDFQSIQNHQEIKDMAFPSNPNQETVIFQSIDSSSSCSPSPVFNLDPSQPFFPTKNCLSSLLGPIYNNPFEGGFDLGCDSGFLAVPASNSSVLMNRGGGVLQGFGDLGSNGQMGAPNLSLETQFPNTRLLPLSENAGFDPSTFVGLDGGASGNALFMNRPKALRPLEIFPPVGAQPTLFQKRAALRQNSTIAEKGGNSGLFGSDACNLIRVDGSSSKEMKYLDEDEEKKRRNCYEDDEMDDASIDASCLNYDSDEGGRNENGKGEEENAGNGGNDSNAHSTNTGVDQKGKKKGFPAKNLMAERRRRKKLNDRLYMLRSVVPKISKV